MARSRSISKRTALAMLLAAALAGCTPSASDKPADLVLGDQAGLGRAKAEAAGVLKGSPFRFEWANFPGAAPLFEALNAGAVDTAPAGDAPTILAAAAKAHFHIIATTRSTGEGIAIIVPQTSSIQSVAGLRRHKVIVSSARGSIAQYLLFAALEEAHVDPREVDIGYMPPNDAASAFAAGQIDAWATFGVYQAVAESRGARILRDGRGINSGVSVIAAADSALADPHKRRAVADYLARQVRAADWARVHPEAYAALYAKRTGVPIDVARKVIQRENPRLVAPTPEIVGELQRVADRFHSFGVLPATVQIAPLVDGSLFPVGTEGR